MKRQTISLTLLALAGLTSGCGREQTAHDGTPSSQESWTQPPRIVEVRRTSDAVLISGKGQPNGRMVLRASSGEAYAVSADGAGDFDLRLPMHGAYLFLTPQAQVGQAQAPAPERLLVIRGGPVARLTPGAAARRLDAAPELGAIDSDGATVLVSGIISSSASVRVQAGGGPVSTRPEKDGFWMLATPAFEGPVMVDGRRFDWPGPGSTQLGEITVARAGAGWRVIWPVDGGGLQSTWLPDR